MQVIKLLLATIPLSLPLISQASFFNDIGDGVSKIGSTISNTSKDVYHSSKEMVGLESGDPILNSRFIDSLEQDFESKDKKNQKDSVRLTTEEGFRQDILRSRMAGQAITPIEQTTAYVNEVLAKILKHWTVSKVTAQAYIVSDNYYGASALQHGSIFIPISTLTKIGSEDELAALLSHEAAHLILNHFDTDIFKALSGQAFKYGELALLLNGQEGSDLLRNYAQVKAANFLINDAFLPSWDRDQENQADILAVDLMVRAGYNTDALLSFLNHIGEHEQVKEDFVISSSLTTQGDGLQRTVTLDIAQLGSDVHQELSAKFSRRHDTADIRKKNVREYIRKWHQDRDRPARLTEEYEKNIARSKHDRAYFKSFMLATEAEALMLESEENLEKAVKKTYNSLGHINKHDSYIRRLMYELRQREGKTNSAYKNLMIAQESGQATYATYKLLYDMFVQNKKYDLALNQLKTIEQDFGSQPGLLPDYIHVVRQMGGDTTPYELRCTAELAKANIDIAKGCFGEKS